LKIHQSLHQYVNNNTMEQHSATNKSKWSHGGLEPNSINILRLISELEGAYQLTKYMAFDEDNAIIDEMKKRYYKLYFQTSKQEKHND
jgi:hypothetical protein